MFAFVFELGVVSRSSFHLLASPAPGLSQGCPSSRALIARVVLAIIPLHRDRGSNVPDRRRFRAPITPVVLALPNDRALDA